MGVVCAPLWQVEYLVSQEADPTVRDQKGRLAEEVIQARVAADASSAIRAALKVRAGPWPWMLAVAARFLGRPKGSFRGAKALMDPHWCG
jgi:hypothetical protein